MVGGEELRDVCFFIFLLLEQLAVSVFGWLRKQQPHCCCFFTDYRKTICCLSGEQQMFKSLRTAKELFEVLQINELNCFTQQVSTFLFFYCIMDNVYIRFSFLKDCFANKVVKFCMKWDTSVQTHLNSSSKDIPLHLPVFIVLKKINSIFWQGRQYKNLKYYKWTLSWCLFFFFFSIFFIQLSVGKSKTYLVLWLLTFRGLYRTHSVCWISRNIFNWPFALLLCLWMDAR